MQNWIAREQLKHRTVQKLIRCSDNYIHVPIPKIVAKYWLNEMPFKTSTSKTNENNASLSFFCFGDEWKESEIYKTLFYTKYISILKKCVKYQNPQPLIDVILSRFCILQWWEWCRNFQKKVCFKKINNNDIENNVKFICKVPWLL